MTTEFYGNAGLGFHSNDARGATTSEDPVTHEAADRVTPLVRATGAEFGMRTVAIPHVQTTVTAWMLDLASELVFLETRARPKPADPVDERASSGPTTGVRDDG